MTDTMRPVRDLLVIALSAAVPLHIHELQGVDETEMVRIAHTCVDEVASRGDSLMFRSRKGASAEAFNALARGLAILAHAPGGVEFLGQHWEVPGGMVDSATADAVASQVRRIETCSPREDLL